MVTATGRGESAEPACWVRQATVLSPWSHRGGSADSVQSNGFFFSEDVSPQKPVHYTVNSRVKDVRVK